jgi:hypothetical protein
MSVRPREFGPLAALAAGVLLGAVLVGGQAPTLRAGAGDRPDAAIVTTAPFATEMNKNKAPITNDAVYYLNYSRAYLCAAVPMLTKTAGASRILSDFAERDLLKDFAIPQGVEPHFAMAAGNLGANGEGWAALYVFETTTGQVAAYHVEPQVRPGSSAPQLLLVEKRTDPRLALARTAAPTTASR